MKIQDFIFLAFFAYLFYKSNPKLTAAFGLLFLAVSIPLFSLWVFFTAERLVFYAAALFLLCIFEQIFPRKYTK